MRHLSILVLLCFFGVHVFAQTAATKDLIASVETKLKGAKNISSKLSFQQYFGDEEGPLMKGDFYSQNNKIRLELPELVFVASDNDTYTYYPKRNEVYIDNVSSAEGLPAVENLTDIFTYLFTSEFDYRKVEDIDENHIVIQFMPRSEDHEYARAFMTVNTTTELPSSVEIHMRDASSFRIELSDLALNKASLESTLFQFDIAQYPDILVEDLRLD